MNREYLHGYAFVKKSKDKIQIFETPYGLGDFVPVVAEGTTTPRMLKDRFADVVNVKDFGAVGDGVHDDTAAFEKAASQKKAVYVPSGSYRLTKWVRGDFCSHGPVAFTAGYAYVKSLSAYSGNVARRDVVLTLPHKFKDYESIKTSLGNPKAYGVQQVAIDSKNEKIYLLYTFDKGSDGKATDVVVQYDFSKNYLGFNLLKLDVAVESFSLASISGEMFAFSRNTAKEVLKYRLADFTCDGSVVSATETIALPLTSADILSCDANGLYLPTNGASGGEIPEAYPIYAYDFSGACKGFTQSQWLNAGPKYTNDKLSNSLVNAVPKLQNFCRIPTGFACIYGSSYPAEQIKSSLQKIALLTDSGDLSASITYTPEKVVEKLASAGLAAVSLEFEGCCFSDGKIFTASTYNTNSATEGIALISEFSDSASAIDFSDCVVQSSDRVNSERIAAGRFPSPSSILINPATGERFESLEQICQFMVSYQLPAFSFFKDQATLTVPDSIANGEPGAFVEIKNVSNKAFNVSVSTAMSTYHYRFTYDKDTNTFSEANRKLLTTTAGIRLTPSNGTSTSPMVRVGQGAANSWWFALLRASLVANKNVCNMTVGGLPSSSTSEASAAVSIIEFYTRGEEEDAKASQRTFALKKNVAYPGVDSAVSLGNGPFRWTQLYANTGAINTSDEREKTSVGNPDDSLMRAWAKVNFKIFQFKDAFENKGESARLHCGVIAQQVIEAFASEGLDATRYGLLCYDKWEDEYEDVEVIDAPEIVADDSTVTPAVTHVEHRLVTPAGDRYGIRYEEALALEAAYQRWRMDKLEAALIEKGVKL